MKGLIGKKLGMTSIYTEDGAAVPVTVIEAGPCVVTQLKDEDKDGYKAVQLGYGDQKEQRLNKPALGHLKKAGVAEWLNLLKKRWSRRVESNHRPADYESAALPLSYAGH